MICSKWFEPGGRSHIMSIKYDLPGECSPEKDVLMVAILTDILL